MTRDGGPGFVVFDSAGKNFYRCRCKEIG
jgi:hypothetical protein